MKVATGLGLAVMAIENFELPVEWDLGLFYECLACGDLLPTVPDVDEVRCRCGNIVLDWPMGQFHVSVPADVTTRRVDRSSEEDGED